MSFEIAKEKAFRYLALAKKTEYEVREKLKKGNFDDEVIDNVISYLSKLSYINDEEYVDAYIRQCMRLQNYSIFEIKQKLLQKGIKKYIIEEKLTQLQNTDYENKLIKKILGTKCKNMESLKQKQYLYRRGFNINIDYEN
jgi:regulatory protein